MVETVYQLVALIFESDAARAYAVLAPANDLLTAECAYGPRLAALERLALRHGLAGRRLLDVCCGTSRSFIRASLALGGPLVFDVNTPAASWRRPLSRRRHRHHPLEEIRELAQEAGLEVAAVVGQRPGAVLDDELDERVHCKAVFVTRREGRSP